MTNTKRYPLPNGLHLEARKDHYTGLWNVWYSETTGAKFAGPFRTKREAIAVIKEEQNSDVHS